MTDNRKSGIALILGAAGFIITIVLHPSGPQRIAPGQIDHLLHVLIGVHTIALASLPFLFYGGLGLSRRAASVGGFTTAALVVYGFALSTGITSIALDGFVSPSIMRQMVTAEGPAKDLWRTFFMYNGQVDEVFAIIFAAATSIAILLRSASMIRSGALSRGLGIFGCVLAVVTVAAVFSGFMMHSAHGFSLVFFGQALWFMIAGALLLRMNADLNPV